MTILTRNHCQSIIWGSTLFSAGGGLTFSQQQTIVREIRKPIVLEDHPAEHSTALIPFELGEAHAPSITTRKLIWKLVQACHSLQMNIDTVLPAEMGQESVAFMASDVLQVPILDMDMAGGRAAPRLPINIFAAAGIPFLLSPIVVIDAKLKTRVFRHIANVMDAESILRNVAMKNNGVCVVAGIMDIDKKMRALIHREKTITRAQRVGESLRKRQNLDIPVEREFDGVIIAINRKSRDGFSGQTIVIQSLNDRVLTVINENENLIVREDHHVVEMAPTIITLFNVRKRRGLHCSEIRIGQPVKVLFIKPLALWQTIRGRHLWEKFALGAIQ